MSLEFTELFTNEDNITKTDVDASVDLTLQTNGGRVEVTGSAINPDTLESYFSRDNVNGYAYKNNSYDIIFAVAPATANRSGAEKYTFGVRLIYDDGTVYTAGIQSADNSNQNAAGVYHNLSGVGSYLGSATSTKWWLKLEISVSGNDRLFKIYSQSVSPFPSTNSFPTSGWGTALDTQILSSGAAKYPTRFEVAYFKHEAGAGSSIDFTPGEPLLDNYNLQSDDLPYVDPTDAAIPSFEELDVFATVNGIGYGKFSISDPGLANKATHLSNINTTVTVSDAQGATRFKGEVRTLNMQRNKVQYQLRDYKAKLTKTRVLVQTIQYAGFTRSLYDGSLIIAGTGAFIKDDRASYTLDAFNGMILTMKQNNVRQARYNEISEDYIDAADKQAWTPDANTLGILDLYYNDPSVGKTTNRASARRNSAVGIKGIAITFEIWAEAFAEISEVRIKGVARFRSFSGVDRPRVYYYDYTNEIWQLQRTVNRDEYGQDDAGDDQFGLDETSDVQINDVFATSSDYYSETVGTNLNKYEIKYLMTLSRNSALDNTLHFKQLYAQVTYSADQTPVQGRFYINDTDTDKVEMSAAETWESVGPLEDGFSADGDLYIITKNMSAALNDVFTDAGKDITLSLSENVTNLDQYGFASEFQNKYISEMISRIMNQFNAYDWVTYSSDTYNIVSADNFTSSGVTLTRLDIPGYDDDVFVHVINADNIVEKVLVKGDGDLTSQVQLSPEYAHTLGDETFIVDDQNIKDQDALDKAAADWGARMDSAERIVRFTINISAGPQLYTALDLGKTVAVQLPSSSDTSVMNYSSAGDGELVLWSYRLRRSEETGQQDLMDLELRRIYT